MPELIIILCCAFFAFGYLCGKHKYKVPLAKTGYRDEFLIQKNGFMVPLSPPEYVNEGQNPVRAARERTQAEGIRYTTRRVS